MNLRRFTAAAVLATTAVSHAQERTLEEIVVFGDLRPSALDELPASVSVLDAGQLTRRSAGHLDEALALSANVNVAAGASRSRFFQVRGIGERGQFLEPLNPSVGVLVDGVDLSNAAMASTLFDVDQVEVFRGPQGTRYGANALAGLINVRTRDPDDTRSGYVGFDAANYDSLTVVGALSGPLGESVSGRFAWQQHNSDGFLENAFLGVSDTNSRDETSMRGKLRWQAGEALTIDAMLGLIDIDNGYDAFSLDNDRITRSDEPGRDEQDTRIGSVRASWTGPDHVTIEATLGIADSQSTYGYDEDWTWEGFDAFGYSSTDFYLRDRSTLTAEVRVLSNEASQLLDGRANWSFGIYTLSGDEDLDRDYTFAAERFSSAFDVGRMAAFAQIDIDLSALTRFTAGLRIERHEASYADSNGATFDPTDRFDGWRLGVDHMFASNIMGYALLAGGYKAGGFNTNGSLPAALRNFAPEQSTNFELGIKGDFLDGRVNLRVALFDMARDAIQLDQSIVVVREDNSSEFIEYIDNAVEGSNTGMEAEILWRPGTNWEFRGTFGLLDTQYDNYVNVLGEDISGREQPHAPEYQFALSLRRNFNDATWLEVSADGRDAFYFSSSHSARSQSYTSFNAALGFEIQQWTVRVWGRNLNDDDIYVRGYRFGNDPRIGYDTRTYTQLGEPRRAGLAFTRRF